MLLLKCVSTKILKKKHWYCLPVGKGMWWLSDRDGGRGIFKCLETPKFMQFGQGGREERLKKKNNTELGTEP